MKVLAFDPGSSVTAAVEWDGAIIRDAQKYANELVCGFFMSTDSIVLIEQITGYGMPVGKEVFDTCWWSGRFYEAAMEAECCVHMVPRRDVKLWHCGTPAAKDSNVIAALKEKYGEKGTKKAPGLTHPLSSDTWQAFALATYWTEKYGRRNLSD